MKQKLYGVVMTHDGDPTWQQYVYCEDAPKHLQHLMLVGVEKAIAQPGDRVVLEYRTTPTSGGWYAKKL